MAKHIGIVAVSAEGAALCYQAICKEGSEIMGRHMHPEVSMHTYPLGEHLKYVESSDWEGLADLMTASAEKLIKIGADFLICPDNTNHLAFEYLEKRAGVKWLHIAEEVADVAKNLGFKKVGVLGTRFIMESSIYPDKFESKGIDYMIPGAEQRAKINTIIFDELVPGIIKEDSKRYLLSAIDDLKSKGCDSVVLGCTEIPLIVFEADSSLPTLDSTRILARAALKYAIRDN